MKFCIYSEIQYWPGKSPARAYEEVVEQVVHADRLGFDGYAIIEHFFFPEVLDLGEPVRALGHMRGADARRSLPDARPRPAVPQPDDAGIADRRRRHPLRGPLRVRPAPRPRLDPAQGRCADRGDATATRSRSRSSSRRSSEERFSYDGKFYKIDDAHVVPRPISSRFRIFLGGTSDKTYELAAERGWGVSVPPLLPYAAMRDQLDLYRDEVRRARHDAGHRLDPCLLPGRGPRHGACARPSRA